MRIFELGADSQTELVVLSAYETDISSGSDFSLIVHSFSAIGANRVVVSLWSVDDEATSIWLSQYMKLRQSGTMNDAQALRTAMLTI